MKQDIVCVIYVDAIIIAGTNPVAIDNLITSLGIVKEERHVFELRDEGGVRDFLDIHIERSGPKNFTLTQTVLIAKSLHEANLESCNTAAAPLSTVPLCKDVDGDPFNESWEYASLWRILIFLANNSRPEITCTVNQCARFTYFPMNSHAISVKYILLCFKGTWDKSMNINPTGFYNVD